MFSVTEIEGEIQPMTWPEFDMGCGRDRMFSLLLCYPSKVSISDLFAVISLFLFFPVGLGMVWGLGDDRMKTRRQEHFPHNYCM